MPRPQLSVQIHPATSGGIGVRADLFKPTFIATLAKELRESSLQSFFSGDVYESKIPHAFVLWVPQGDHMFTSPTQLVLFDPQPQIMFLIVIFR